MRTNDTPNALRRSSFILETSERQRKEIAECIVRASISRSSMQVAPALPQFVRIITGIRRCGKSTLVSKDLFSSDGNGFYLNFEEPALYDFSPADFIILEEAISEFQKERGGEKKLYFDEIQVVGGWEVFVNAQLERGNLVTITGSNASLLSWELGTRLTGRHLDYELFSFSFEEFCCLKNCGKSPESFLVYLQKGGFPEYLLYGRSEILNRLFEDILMRDIVVRHGIKDVRSIKTLAVYLASSCGNLVTGSRLSAQLGLKTTATILECLSFLEQSYLFFLVPKFNPSARAQSINPKKVYGIDTGLTRSASLSASKDLGRLFENAVFLELRRKTRNIWYYSEAAFECDFLYGESTVPENALQACLGLTSENREWEVRGAGGNLQEIPPAASSHRDIQPKGQDLMRRGDCGCDSGSGFFPVGWLCQAVPWFCRTIRGNQWKHRGKFSLFLFKFTATKKLPPRGNLGGSCRL